MDWWAANWPYVLHVSMSFPISTDISIYFVPSLHQANIILKNVHEGVNVYTNVKNAVVCMNSMDKGMNLCYLMNVSCTVFRIQNSFAYFHSSWHMPSPRLISDKTRGMLVPSGNHNRFYMIEYSDTAVGPSFICEAAPKCN